MLKDTAVLNDIFTFVGSPTQCFDQALQQASEIKKLKPKVEYEIVYDSKTAKTTLTLDRPNLLSDYGRLFGSGDVPGMLTDEDMMVIKDLSTQLPQTGIFVEVGSLLGKSTVEWAKNLKSLEKDYKILAIDSFNTSIDILRDLLIFEEFDVPDSTSHLEMFKHYTKKYPNIKPLVAFFNEDFVFEQTIAGVFEDSDHTQRTLSYSLPFWWEKIIPGGILCGHDYKLRDVQVSVDRFALLHDLEVNVGPNGSSIWWIKK